MQRAIQYVEENQGRFTEELQALVRQPSIAAQGVGMEETAYLVRQALERIGATVRIIPTKGFPVVYGELRGDSDRTLVSYNHYDVQPPEPLELWSYPPFGAEIHDGKMFGRGVSDNKGNFMSRVQAAEAILRTRGSLPVTMKFVLEGEEEIGSVHLPSFVERHRDLLRGDGCLWEAGYKDVDDRPVIRLGMKGILSIELVARGARVDYHSSQAVVLPNPAWDLVWALGTLRGPDGRVRIPGFYEDILPISQAEREALARVPINEAKLKEQAGVVRFNGDLQGQDIAVALATEPTCNIAGIASGYTGEGMKTVLPREAKAKLDLRMVVDMDPEKILHSIREHLEANGFGHIEVKLLSAEKAGKTPVDDPFANLVVETAREVYGQEPVVLPSAAGSGPMHLFREVGLPCVSIGVGWARSQNHAPNESIRMADYWEGVRHVIAIIYGMGRQ